MSYKDLFTRYGSPSTEADIRISGYLIRPDQLTPSQIGTYDQTAARLIERCQQTVEALQEYRQALAFRYADLSTQPYKLRLELERYAGYRGNGVKYYVSLVQTYQDGTDVFLLRETYQGKQRREALARFEELKKQRPGIETVKDIDRKPWER